MRALRRAWRLPAGQRAPSAPRLRWVSMESLEPRILLSADLAGEFSVPAIDPVVHAGEQASVSVLVRNTGSEAPPAPIRIDLHASLDASLDAADPKLASVLVDPQSLPPMGDPQGVALDVEFTTALAPGSYRLLAHLDSEQAATESDETNNIVVSAESFEYRWQFGAVPGHASNLDLEIVDTDGTAARFSLAGAGTGTVTPGVHGYDLVLESTYENAAVTVVATGGDDRFSLTTVSVLNGLGSLQAPSMGRLIVPGDFGADLDLTGDPASGMVMLGAQIGGAITGGTWNVQGRAGQISAGSIADSWRASFTEPVSSLVTRGDLGGDIALPSLGVLQVGGDLKNARIVVGADYGADGLPGGAGADADAFVAGNLPRVRVAGAMIDSRIWVGIDPVDGIFDNGNDRLAPGPGGEVREIGIGGLLSQLSGIASQLLPVITRVDQQTLNTGQVAQFVTRPVDRVGPAIAASLANDTGNSSADRITSDPSVAGTVSDFSGIATFTAGFGSTDPAAFVDVTAALQPSGEFVLVPAVLDAIAGGGLADGAHTLKLLAVDAAGNSSAVAALDFVLDTTAPPLAAGLSAGSDTGAAGDGVTSAARVTVTGVAEAGATVALDAATVLAGAGGAFLIPDVVLASGENVLALTATDPAGNVGQSVLTLNRVGTADEDVALVWNQTALELIRRTVSDPPVATRTLALVSLAQYDTLAAIEGTPAYLVSRSASGQVSLDAALAQAAYTVLSTLFPGQRASLLDVALAQSLQAVAPGEALANGLALGQSIAEAVLAVRSTDGSDSFVDYPGSGETGRWRPTAPMFDVADYPQWAWVAPFALASPDQFRPAAPPAIDSAAYALDVEEVRRLGGADSTERSTEQSEIAQFWADGAGSYTPPGHWNAIAEHVAREAGNSVAANVRLFAQLNVALADASIASWDAKYAYGLWRPIDAINGAHLDNNPATEQEAGWTPLLFTPPHPEYVSGHSTYSAAAANVLTALYGDDLGFDTTAVTLPGVTRSYPNFMAAAAEAGRSRIYGGIHYQFSNQAGQALGGQIAQAVLARFALNEDTQAPRIVASASPAAANGNITLAGQILDNLSGVASAQYHTGDGALRPLSLGGEGRFSIVTEFALDGTDDGLHTLTIVATDAAGNAAQPFARAFMLDTRAPDIELTSLADGAVLDGESLLEGFADATGSTLVSLAYRFDSGTSRTLIFDPTTGAFDTLLAIGDLAAGDHTLTLSAKDAAGNASALALQVSVADSVPATVVLLTPADGGDDIGVTYRPQLAFSRAVDPATLTEESFYATGPDGQKLAARVVPAAAGRGAWLFFDQPMPGGARITLTVDGARIRAAADGSLLDADGDGSPGGVLATTFTTVSREPIAGTKLAGKVVDPGPDLQPMTFDDIRRGPDGIIRTADDVLLLPIAGAKVFILGQEDNFVFTDAEGNFELEGVPVGNVKIAIDGRTATNAPPGIFFPEMVMDADLLPGIVNTVMGSMGGNEERIVNAERFEVYLPRIDESVLRTVSDTEPTVITTDAAGAPNLTDAEREALTLTVPPGAAIGEDGLPMENVRIGIATVPPELVRDMLPPGVLQHTFDITIQAPGVAVFAQPVQITFPNVFNAAPGTKLNILSFDHTTGRLVINGTGTVSEDGRSVTSDEGAGIQAPGWHGMTLAGVVSSLFGFAGIEIDPACVDFAIGAAELAVPALKGFRLLSNAPKVLDFIKATDDALKLASPLVTGGSVNSDPFKNALDDMLKSAGKVLYDGTMNLNKLTYNPNNLSAAASAAVFQQSTYTKLQAGALAARGIIKLFDLKQLYDNAVTCFGGSGAGVAALSSMSFSMLASVSALASPPDVVDALGRLVDRLEAALAPLARATSMLLEQGLEQRLTGIVSLAFLDFADGFVSVQTPAGPPVIDPSTGHPLRFALSDLIDVSIDADPQRRAVLATLLEEAAFVASGSGDPSQSIEALAEAAYLAVSRERDAMAGTPGRSLAVTDAWVLVSSIGTGEAVYRGKVDAFGSARPFLGVGDSYYVEMFSPSRDLYGAGSLTGLVAGRAIDNRFFLSDVRGIALFPTPGGDDDGDGLKDLGERVIGTSPVSADSDGDGVLDTLEVLAGLNPLDGRPAATGVIAGLALAGEARALSADHSVASDTPIIAVATGSAGVAFVDVTRSERPLLLREVDLPGVSTDVAFDGALGYAAVASNAGGLNVVGLDGSVRNIAINAAAVEITEGIVYVNNGAEVQSFDLLTGERRQTLALAGSGIVSMALGQQVLYTVDSVQVLRAIDLGAGTMIERSSLVLPFAPSRLFAAEGVVYVGAETVFTGGYATVDASDPDALSLLSGVDVTGIGGKAIALNGSGLAVSVGSPGGLGNLASVLDVTDPTRTDQLIGQFPVAADPFDVAIAAGIAYVADGLRGLAVVNYLAFDNRGMAPSITAQALTADLDPATDGLQVQEGSVVPLQVTVGDDVQVRSVALLVNGAVVREDLSYPFDLAAPLPSIAANGGDRVTVQVRATDTGGNVGLSAPIEFVLLPDIVAPVIIQSNVSDGLVTSPSFGGLRMVFSEPMDEATLNASTVQLVAPDGSIVAPINIQFRQQGREVQFTYDRLSEVGAYQFRLVSAGILDRAGNPLGASDHLIDVTVQAFSAEWIGPSGGFWDVAANWSTGALPTDTDDVFIGLPAGEFVVFRSGSATVASLVSDGGLNLTGGVLNVEGHADFRGPLRLSGGTLGGSGTLTLTGLGSQWSGGVMTGGGTTRIAAGADLTVGGAARKYLGNRTIVNEGLLIEASTGDLVDLDGAAVLENVGTFDIRSDESWQHFLGAAGSLVLDNRGTVVKSAGSASFNFEDTTLNNTGTIEVRVGTLAFSGVGRPDGASSGSFEVSGGATLRFYGGVQTLEAGASVSGLGRVQVSGGTLDLNAGSYTIEEFRVDALSGVVLGTLSVDTDLSVSRLLLAPGGTLTGTGTLTLTGLGSQWSGGVMTGGGTTRIAAGADLTVGGAARKYLGNRTIVNEGLLIEASTGDLVDLDGAATLNNAGTFDIRGDQSWQHFLGTAGSLVLDNSGTLKKSAGVGDFGFEDTTLNNIGTVQVQVGTLAFSAAGRPEGTSSGSFEVSDDATLRFYGGVQHLETGASMSGLGRVQVSGGTLDLNAGSYTIEEFRVDALSGVVLGTLSVDTDLSVSRLLLAPGGTLTGTGTLTLTGLGSEWTGGVMTGGGTTKIAVGAELTVGGTSRKNLGDRTILNEGLLIEAATSEIVDLDGVAVLNNIGTFDIRGNRFWEHFIGAAGTLTIENTGTLKKSAGTGTFTFYNTVLNNAGTVEVQVGRLSLGGGGTSTGEFRTGAGASIAFIAGTQTWQSGVTVGGEGAIVVTFTSASVGGTLAVEGNVAAPRLDLEAVGTLTGAGVLTLTGTGSQWSSGVMTGGGTTRIAASGELSVVGASRKYLGNRTLVNEGLLIDAATNDIVELDGAATLNNAGTFDVRGDQAWMDFVGAAGSLVVNNSGTLKKSVGSGDFGFEDTTLNNIGTVQVQVGTLAFSAAGRPEGTSSGSFEVSEAATLRFYGGVQRLEAGASMSGEGRVQVSGGTLDLNAGSYTIEEFLVDQYSAVVLGTLSVDTDLSVSRLLLAPGGTLTGTGTLTLTGLGSQWTGGVMTGGGTTKIAVGAELTVGGASRKNLGDRTILNEGLLIEASTGDLVDLNGVAVLNNTGTFDIRSTRSWQHFVGAAGSLTIFNSGTLTKTAGDGDFAFASTTLNNTGTITVLVGRILVNGVPL